MKEIQQVLIDATKQLDTVLPSHVRCVIVCIDTLTGEVAATSDLSEENASLLLEEGAKVLKMPVEPEIKIIKSKLDSN